jgi:hypothetical protein
VKLSDLDLDPWLLKESDTASERGSEYALQTRLELLTAHSSLPAVLRPVHCERFFIDVWVVCMMGFLVAAAGIIIGTIACSNGVFLVTIAGVVQAFAAWTLLVHVGRIPTRPALPTGLWFTILNTTFPWVQVMWCLGARVLEPMVIVPTFYMAELVMTLCLALVCSIGWVYGLLFVYKCLRIHLRRHEHRLLLPCFGNHKSEQKNSNPKATAKHGGCGGCAIIGAQRAVEDCSILQVARAVAFAGATVGFMGALHRSSSRAYQLSGEVLEYARKAERQLIGDAASRCQQGRAAPASSSSVSPDAKSSPKVERSQPADKLEQKLLELQVMVG